MVKRQGRVCGKEEPRTFSKTVSSTRQAAPGVVKKTEYKHLYSRVLLILEYLKKIRIAFG